MLRQSVQRLYDHTISCCEKQDLPEIRQEESSFTAIIAQGVLSGYGGRTVLTVAQRLTTAQEADRVLVMEAGQIVEAGPPQELIRQGGRFAALLALEAAGWDWQTDGRAGRA